jgi:hypothetical protein
MSGAEAKGGETPVVSRGSAAKPRPRSRWRRRVLIALALVPVALIGLWIAIHKINWLGPWLADLGRSVVGNDAIAKLEDFAYGVEDRVNRATKADEAPEPLWDVPAEVPAPAPSGSAGPAPSRYPTFRPADVGPMLKSFSAPGDGVWVPIADARHPGEPAPLFKTLLHPDKNRSWSSVVVVAADLRQVHLHLVAGVHEPMTKDEAAKKFARTGLVADEDLKSVIAVFNGGFKTTHGHYGMKAHGVTFVPPRARSCTLAAFPAPSGAVPGAPAGESLEIRSWEVLEPRQDQIVWFRQTPMCMVEEGKLHPGLQLETNTHWGSTLDKNTVIRRSAVGLSADRTILYAGISEATSATTIATAMQFAGAANVAQLDVNFSYPKFVTVEKAPEPKEGRAPEWIVVPVAKGFELTENDYLRKEMGRDFFYLTRSPPP